MEGDRFSQIYKKLGDINTKILKYYTESKLNHRDPRREILKITYEHIQKIRGEIKGEKNIPVSAQKKYLEYFKGINEGIPLFGEIIGLLEFQPGSGVIDYFRQLIFGRDKPTSKVKKLLKQCGDKKITGLTIVRQPISGGIQKMLNALTLGKIKKDMVKQGYDRLFHLSSVIKLDGCPDLRFEKNETVNLEKPKKFHPESEFRNIPVQGDITLQEAYDNLKKLFDTDKDFYGYDSISNNCQLFIRKFLMANKKNFKYKQSDLDFISQDIRFIAKKYPYASKIARTLTDIANKLGVLTGEGENNISSDNINKMKAYCVKCRAKKDIEGGKVHNGKRRMLKGKCGTCGTSMVRFLKKGEKVEGKGCPAATKEELAKIGVKDRKTFRKWAMKEGHPDKGGDKEFFDMVLCAIEVMEGKDKDTRRPKPKPTKPEPKKPEPKKPEPKKPEPKKPEPKKEEFDFSSEEQLDDVIDTKSEKSAVEKALIAGAITLVVGGVAWGVNKFRKWLKKKKSKKGKGEHKHEGGSAVERKFNKWMIQHGGKQQSFTGVIDQQTGDGSCKCEGGARLSLVGISRGPSEDTTQGGNSRMSSLGFKRVF